MKRINTIIISSLAILLMTGISIAGDRIINGVQGSEGYVAPTLEYSIRPEPVTYAPGRIVEGYVTLELKIGTSGNVEEVKVLYRTSKLAVKSAVNAIENWKFLPAQYNGEPVTAYVAYSLPFGYNLQIFANDNYADRILDPANGDQIAMK